MSSPCKCSSTDGCSLACLTVSSLTITPPTVNINPNSGLQFEPDSPCPDDADIEQRNSSNQVLTLEIVKPCTPPLFYFERVDKTSKAAILPSRSTEYAAGYDLYAPVEGVIPARGKGIIPTGWKIRIPSGMYGRIAPRSGLAVNHHLDVGAGVVDEDYSKEVGVVIFNHAEVDFKYAPGDRIAQMILETCHTNRVPVEVETLPIIISNRVGGYGSTGVALKTQ
jgi:dUTP pyrophosphatase